MDRDEDLLPVRICNIYPYAEAQQGVGGGTQSFLVFLKGEASTVVPIKIGHFEGQALVMALRKIPLPRPLPHNLLLNLLEKMNATVQRLVIHTLLDEVFHAYLFVETPSSTFCLDCRPSDGMILATLAGTPMYMTPAVMAQAGRDVQAGPTSCAAPEAPKQAGGQGRAGRQGAPAPRRAGSPSGSPPEMTELDRLNLELTRLVAEEAYEEAARVRDQIRELRDP